MKRFSVAIALLAGGCTDASDKSPLNATVRGVTYQLPRNDIRAAALDPAGMLFVRASPSGAKFHLILDALPPYIANKQGAGVPIISRVNDNKFGKFEVLHVPGGPVVCMLGPQPHYNCGLSINDGLVKWGVIFDRREVHSARSMRRQAEATIRRYRTSDNG